jgi:hypothetical protein
MEFQGICFFVLQHLTDEPPEKIKLLFNYSGYQISIKSYIYIKSLNMS